MGRELKSSRISYWESWLYPSVSQTGSEAMSFQGRLSKGVRSSKWVRRVGDPLWEDVEKSCQKREWRKCSGHFQRRGFIQALTLEEWIHPLLSLLCYMTGFGRINIRYRHCNTRSVYLSKLVSVSVLWFVFEITSDHISHNYMPTKTQFCFNRSHCTIWFVDDVVLL